MPEFKDKYVLVTGNKDVMSVCQEYGYTKAIHAEELYALMPYLCPLAMKEFPDERRLKRKETLLARLGKQEDELIKDLQFAAIMIMSDVFCLEMSLQLCSDLILSVDGRIGGQQRTSPSDP